MELQSATASSLRLADKPPAGFYSKFWQALREQDLLSLEEMLSDFAPECFALRDPTTQRGPVEWCCFLRKRDALRALLAWGADPDEAIGGRATPLCQAAASHDEECIAMLMEAGADPDLANPDGLRNPLVEAASLALAHQSESTLRRLLAEGANPNAITPAGAFALGASSIENRPADIHSLVSAGAEVDLHSGDGFTALFYAVDNGCAEAAAALLRAGASQSARTEVRGIPMTALEMAQDANDTALAGLLYAFSEAHMLRERIGIAQPKSIRPMAVRL